MVEKKSVPSYRVVGRSPKCIRKNPARRIQKNLRNTYWYICYKLFKTGKFHTFFSFLYDTCFMSRIIQILLCYAVQYIFEYFTHQSALREARPNTAPFLLKACLRKFIGARELFRLRPYFQIHSTEKRSAKLSWVPLQIIFSLGRSKPQSKYKIWV